MSGLRFWTCVHFNRNCTFTKTNNFLLENFHFSHKQFAHISSEIVLLRTLTKTWQFHLPKLAKELSKPRTSNTRNKVKYRGLTGKSEFHIHFLVFFLEIWPAVFLSTKGAFHSKKHHLFLYIFGSAISNSNSCFSEIW